MISPGKSLEQQQVAFATLLRDGTTPPLLSHIEERRRRVYQELFYNNMEGLLASGFPVLHKILGREPWQALVRKFWQQHRCQTPYFPKIGAEFVQWLFRARIPDGFPFLPELAHYEWMEVVVDTADIVLPEPASRLDNLHSETTLAANPAMALLHYQFPVHRISPDFLPEEAGIDKTHLLVYRRRDHQVKFMELSLATVILLDLLQNQPRSLRDLITTTEQSLRAEAGSLKPHIEAQVSDFIRREVIFI